MSPRHDFENLRPQSSSLKKKKKKVKLREIEADCHCSQIACNRSDVISSLSISRHQLELSICLLKVNCLHTYEAYVSHDPQSLQHGVACLE